MGAYRKLQQDLGILLATQIFAQNITNFIVPYILLIVKMRTSAFRKDEERRARERDVDARRRVSISGMRRAAGQHQGATMEATQYVTRRCFRRRFRSLRS